MRRVEITNHTIHPDEENDACLGDWLACYGYAIDREPRLLKGLVPKKVYRWAVATWGRTGDYATFSDYLAGVERVEVVPVRIDRRAA